MRNGRKNPEKPKAALLGLGLDNSDGHVRMTKGDNFQLVGGSAETHERMTETAIKFNEKLDDRGKRIEEISKEEFVDILRDAADL